MSDFESRLRHALGAGAEGAPAAAGLAGVPLGIGLLGGDDAPDRTDDVVAADELPTVPAGWRWESWRDAQVAVPGDWTEGAASQYCISPTPLRGSPSG